MHEDRVLTHNEYLQIVPAKALAKPDHRVVKLWNDDSWVAEKKLDGYRYLVHFGKNLTRPAFTGRRLSNVSGTFSEKAENVRSLWPEHGELGYTVIDGEVMPPPGYGFRDLAGIMNASHDKARARIKEIGSPMYYAFDLLFLDGQDLRAASWHARHTALAEIYRSLKLSKRGFVVIDFHREHKEAFYERVIKNGGEGIMLKDTNAPYGKSGAWIKVKRFSTLDVIITGYTEAAYGLTGKYDGQIGAIKVSVWEGRALREVGQVSGFSDVWRKEFTARPKAYVGKVIEVKAQELAKDRLRHPRFSRMRSDADPKDATWKKMLRDLSVTQSREKS
jgi:bifunctional non-homologous end joining protein LigD